MIADKKYIPEPFSIACFYLFEDEFIQAINKLKENKIVISSLFSPYPVHALEKMQGNRKSELSLVGLLCGFAGATVAFLFQYWVATIEYPLNYGGKPSFALPSFIPVIFETTILFAVMGMFFYYVFLLVKEKKKLREKGHFFPSSDYFIILIETGIQDQSLSAENLVEFIVETKPCNTKILD